jgi:hypothetical protein
MNSVRDLKDIECTNMMQTNKATWEHDASLYITESYQTGNQIEASKG